jgi:hypothetical protein
MVGDEILVKDFSGDCVDNYKLIVLFLCDAADLIELTLCSTKSPHV